MKQCKIKSTKNIGSLREKGEYTTTTSFKSKSDSLQFSSTLDYKGDIEDILDEQNLHESTVEALNDIVSKISKRNKLIKNADRSPGRMRNYC